ncbi:MAG: hypothetical protein ACPGUU_02535 [Flavobacteriaceae bacterium]
MKNRILVCLLMVFSIWTTIAQKSVNDYKYIIVPKQFEFLNEPDKHQTSSLTKFLFNKYGYKAILSDEKFPDDLANNKCLALTSLISKESSFINTKIIISLRDCFNNVVFESKTGRSKEKTYKKAYHDAIRKAFVSVQRLNYKYTGVKSETPKVVPVIQTKEITSNIVTTKENNILYAQKKEYGYQLVNTKPEIVFRALKTDVENVFIIKDKNGILYKKNTIWLAEFYVDGKKVIKQYQIKF